jgi:hypothetical protein
MAAGYKERIHVTHGWHKRSANSTTIRIRLNLCAYVSIRPPASSRIRSASAGDTPISQIKIKNDGPRGRLLLPPFFHAKFRAPRDRAYDGSAHPHSIQACRCASRSDVADTKQICRSAASCHIQAFRATLATDRTGLRRSSTMLRRRANRTTAADLRALTRRVNRVRCPLRPHRCASVTAARAILSASLGLPGPRAVGLVSLAMPHASAGCTGQSTEAGC